MEDNAEQSKSQQLNLAMNTLKGLSVAIGNAMEGGVSQIGIGKSETLSQPVTDSFGTFNARKDYYLGCDIGKVIEEKGGVVVFTTEELNKRKVVEIGKVPAAYNPNEGGVLIAEAGKLQDYLAAIKSKDQQTQAENIIYRYVDGSEISGAIAEKGKPVTLNPAPDGSRTIAVQGNVTSITSLN